MAGPQQASTVHPAVFREQTRPNSVSAGSVTFAAFSGAPQTINLPHSGWLGRLFVMVSGSLTTGAGTPAGSWATYPPFPWNLSRLIRVVTNTQTEICRMSGWALYLFNRFYRRNSYWDLDVDTDYNTTNRAALLAFPAAGTPAASTVYPVAAVHEIPIMTDDALSLGMLFLQSDQVQLGVEITPPTATDVHNVTGVTVTPSLTYSAQAVFFEQPPDLSVRPNTQYVHMLREENRAINGTGQQLWPVALGNTYLKLFGMLENNGAAIANTNILSMLLQYAQTVTPFNEPYNMHVARNKAYLGSAIPDGSYLFDFTHGSGVEGFYEGRDFLNSSLVTDLSVVASLSSGLSLSSPNHRLMSEQLQAIGGP